MKKRQLLTIPTITTKFWEKYPALWYGLLLLLGTIYGISSNAIVVMPLCYLISFAIFKSGKKILRCSLAITVFLSGIAYTKHMYKIPPKEFLNISGKAIISINSFGEFQSSFGKFTQCKGSLEAFFIDDKKVSKNLPISIILSRSASVPSLDKKYLVEGSLKRYRDSFSLKVNNKCKWKPVSQKLPISKWRQKLKEHITASIDKITSDPRSKSFFQGILTGEFSNRRLTFELSRVGLLHIMAISGFHFSLVAIFISCILKMLSSPKVNAAITIICTTAYFAFIGPSPSVMRAWIMQTIFFMGFIVERRSSCWNSLGVALLAVIAYEPIACTQIGFQFSFAVTASILLFYPYVDNFLQEIWSNRKLKNIIESNILCQHAYVMMVSFRKLLSLTLAAHIVAIPMSLCYFHNFSILSIFYGLFFPFIITISMLILMVAIFTNVLWGKGAIKLFCCSESIVNFALNLVYNLPLTFHWRIYSEYFSPNIIAIYLSSIFFFATTFKKRDYDEFSFAF